MAEIILAGFPEVPGATRERILQLAEETCSDDTSTAAYEELYGMRHEAVRVILDAYASGHYDKFTSYPMSILDVCISEADGVLAGEYLTKRPHIYTDQDYKAIGRIARADIIPSLHKHLGPLPADNRIGRGPIRNKLSGTLLLANRARTNARDDSEREQWDGLISRLLSLRDANTGEKIFVNQDKEAVSQIDPRSPDRWALEAARIALGQSHGNTSRYLDHLVALPAKDRTQALANIWTRIDATSTARKLGERVLGIANREEFGYSPYAVPIGIEVEVEADSLVRDRTTDTPDERLEYMRSKLQGFHDVEQDGIPAGQDEEWEYAHRPARHYRTLLREVHALDKLDLLNLGYPNPLHVTLGDITTEGPGGDEVYVLAQSLLATGWSTTGDRIRQPLDKDHGTWAHLSKGGVHEREPADVMPPSSTAVEFRVHTAQGFGNVALTLRAFYELGAALRAYQMEVNRDDLADEQVALSAIWQEFSANARELFCEHELADPGVGPWHAEGEHSSMGKTKKLDDNYVALAALLDDAAANHNSKSRQTQDEFRRLFIQQGARAMKILDSTRTAPTAN